MSAVLDLGEGRYIAGEAPERPGPGEHWCFSCAGSGIELGDDVELGVCVMCFGACVEVCGSTECGEHHAEMDTAN
ncbi:hypothetical protein ACWGOE_07185 [Leucobacter chromiiresistens]